MVQQHVKTGNDHGEDLADPYYDCLSRLINHRNITLHFLCIDNVIFNMS